MRAVSAKVANAIEKKDNLHPNLMTINARGAEAKRAPTLPIATKIPIRLAKLRALNQDAISFAVLRKATETPNPIINLLKVA